MRRLRTLRAALVALATAFPAVVLTAGTAHAAPPVGCYGFPSIPDAFVCVTSFTPQNVVPSVDGDGSTFTIPEFCAGDCYGPIPVSVPAVVGGSGQVAVITYDGGTYAIVVGQVPDGPGIGGGACPGEAYLGVDLGPYVCTGLDYYTYGETYWILGTCLTDPCTLFYLPLDDLNDRYREVLELIP